MEQNHKLDEASRKTEASSIYTIYCHFHRESGRRYIGLTSKRWERRWSEHLSKAKNNARKKILDNHWYNTIRLYGPEAFDHEILQVCHDLESANIAEEYWIELYDTTNPIRGFNMKRGGSHTHHPIKNPWDRPDYREKMIPISIRNRERTVSPEALAKYRLFAERLNSDPEYRSKFIEKIRDGASRPEARAKCSQAQKGKVLSQEHKDKISRSSRSATPEVREKIKLAVNKDEVKKRLAESISEYWSMPESKIKASRISKEIHSRPEVLAKRGDRKWSYESRLKISESISSKTTTKTHKICKHHGLVPFEKCEKIPNKTGGIRYKCGICRMEAQTKRRARKAMAA